LPSANAVILVGTNSDRQNGERRIWYAVTDNTLINKKNIHKFVIITLSPMIIS